MSMYLLFSYFVAIFSLVAFFSVESLMTSKQYIDWKCGRICEGDSEFKDLVGSACFKLSAAVENPYDEATIKKKSGCRSNIAVQFQEENGTKVAYGKDVGICALKDGLTRCITMGKGKKEMLVYSFTGEGCTLLEGHFEMELVKKQAEPPQTGGIIEVVINILSSINVFG